MKAATAPVRLPTSSESPLAKGRLARPWSETTERSVDDHELIIEAVEKRKPDEARTRMHEHLTRVEEAVERAVRRA